MTRHPPKPVERPLALSHHGRTRVDPFYWLRAENWQAVMRDPAVLAPEIRTHLEAENAYADAWFADTEGLRVALVQEMRGRIKEDDASLPDPDGPYAYYWRYEAGGQHPLYCRRPRGADVAAETVLLNGDHEARGHAYFNIGHFAHSPDHRFAAYAVDLNGSEYYTLRIRDLSTGLDLDDALPNVRGDFVWGGDARTLFYTCLDDSHRPNEVRCHRLGQDPQRDRLVYRESDPAFYVSVSLSRSRRFILITANDHSASEIHVLNAHVADGVPRLIAPRAADHEYDLADHNDRFFVLTNAEGAEDFKIMTAPLDRPERDQWVDWLGHEPGRLILDVMVFRGHLVRLERVNALARLVVTELRPAGERGEEHTIAFDEEAYSLAVLPGYEYDTTRLRFTYSSPSTPQATFDYDLATRARQLVKTQEIPSGHDPAAYVVRRVTAPAHDGEEIPVTLLYRRDLNPGPTTPVLLYGYGAYGISIPAAFATNRLSLVDRGFIFAIAHIRGGKDRGFRWYTTGKRLAKRNTFEDFAAAARHLIALGLTGKRRIVAHGGSAGGLLMGAVANMAGGLFAGIIAEVPFVDTLTTILDPTLPLTPPEWTEWGNPLDSVEVYDYMASYSPYDNVEAKPYPPIFALAGLTDPRVTYWEPAKWIAKLRLLKTDANEALLKVNMDAGHAGASGRFDRLEEVALVYAFALKIVGLADAPLAQLTRQ